MSCYVSSRENRFYASLEAGFGLVAAASESNRLPAVRLRASQKVARVVRRDKTGSRTFVGLPSGLRKETSFELETYLTSWGSGNSAPSCGPLFQAALGGAPLVFGGGTVASITGSQLQFSGAHGLVSGQGISCGGEVRFVTAIADEQTVILNAPFTNEPAAGWPVDRTVTYRPATELPSISVYDYWSPDSSVHRILAGAAVNRLKVDINGDIYTLLNTIFLYFP